MEIKVKCSDMTDEVISVPRTIVKMSRFFESLLSEDHEHNDGEIIDLDIPSQSLRDILEFCAIFDY
jgi:hypothetical protein